MKKKSVFIFLTSIVLCISLVIFRKPTITGELTKQTVYLWLLNICHIQTRNAKPTALLIDDDGGDGIYTIKRICDDLDIKATFAINPSRLDKQKADSLKKWQQSGYGIALHGFNHDNWKSWEFEEIVNDIKKSEFVLENLGFSKNYRFVVSPFGFNTSNIRKAIHSKGYLMVTGANIVNPDTTVFQYGRFFLEGKTFNLEQAEDYLNEACKKNAFIIFGTHSSMDSFSEENTTEVLQRAIKKGFKFI